MSRSRLGCGTHVLIALGLFAIALVVIGYQNRDTVSMMWANVTAMNEGMNLTDELRYPEDVLDYIEAHPETSSLVAYTIGREDAGIMLNAETPRPLVNISHVAALAAYTQAVADGEMDAEARVSLTEIGRHALPGVNAQSHDRTLDHWNEANRIDADSTVAVADIAAAVARFNDAPALDWLLNRLGRRATQAQTQALGWPEAAAPVPRSGLYLEWARASTALQEATTTESTRIGRDAMFSAAARYATDTTYARQTRDVLETRGTNLTLRGQRRIAQTTLPHASAADVAGAFAQMAQRPPGDPLSDTYAMLDRPVGIDTLSTGVQRVISKGGAMPGIISFAGVAHYAGDHPPRVVVLSMEDVPLAVFYHLVQSGFDQGLALRLLGDDAFFQDTRQRIHAADSTEATVL